MSYVKESKYWREGVEGGGAHNQYNRCPKDQLDEFRYVASVSADTHPLCQVKIHFTCCASVTPQHHISRMNPSPADGVICYFALSACGSGKKKTCLFQSLFTLTKFECLIKGVWTKTNALSVVFHNWLGLTEKQHVAQVAQCGFLPKNMPAPCGWY